MNDLVKIIKGFVLSADAKLIAKYAKSNDSLFVEFGNNEKEFTFHANFTNNDIKNLLQQYQKQVYRFVVDNYHGPFEPYDESKIHLARFNEGYGMHEHFDSTKPNDIATLIYINDDYEGGEIYFPELDIVIKPQEGDLVCFPDTPDFVHGVKPISKGIRYTAPRWFTRIV